MAMGARSKLVLLKLGFDMRADYETLLSEPLPNEMRSLIYRMAGSPPDVIELGTSDYTVEDGPLLYRRSSPPTDLRPPSTAPAPQSHGGHRNRRAREGSLPDQRAQEQIWGAVRSARKAAGGDEGIRTPDTGYPGITV